MTDASSNISTNFGISNGNYYDILSTLVSVTVSDPNSTGVVYYFYLGQLLIQFGQINQVLGALPLTYDYPIAYNQTPYAVCLTSLSEFIHLQCFLTSVSKSHI